ncbi:hypothetical protein [Bacillus subtilis]|uniref:hypothetical protein n=1 Tax=Bacillus subtilis TaxID=1423 RepID=UPI0021D979F5|nr:hypothetical protein [Bacillus subtilis]
MTEAMSLTGGLDMYAPFGTRYGSNEPPTGRKVYFLNENGYDMELEHARKTFDEGQVLTVKDIYVGGSSSYVEFVGYPNMKFNTVMFADVV